jgi:hypothetical protein
MGRPLRRHKEIVKGHLNKYSQDENEDIDDIHK